MRRGSLLFAFVITACAAPQGSELAPLPPLSAVEVSFADSYCRRLEEPDQLVELARFFEEHRRGWQPFWGKPLEPQVRAVFHHQGRGVALLGLASRQLVTTLEDAVVFQPLTGEEASRFVTLVGGQPLAPPEIECKGS